MRNPRITREEFMNPSRTILPRVGGGVGVGGGLGVGDLFQDQVDNLTVGASRFGFGSEAIR